VRIVFSDETERGPSETIAAFAAVMMNIDSQLEAVDEDFDRLPKGWRMRREVKGRELFKDIRKGRGKDSGATLKAICAIPIARGIPIFSGVIHRQGFEKVKRELFGEQHNWSAYDVAFAVCLNSVDSYLETLVPWEKILWISDDARNEKTMKEALFIQKVLAQSNIMQKLGGAAAFKSHIVDPIYFGRSHESRALQLADICCSVIVGHLLGDPIAETYYAQIRPRLVAEPVALYKDWIK